MLHKNLDAIIHTGILRLVLGDSKSTLMKRQTTLPKALLKLHCFTDVHMLSKKVQGRQEDVQH